MEHRNEWNTVKIWRDISSPEEATSCTLLFTKAKGCETDFSLAIKL